MKVMRFLPKILIEMKRDVTNLKVRINKVYAFTTYENEGQTWYRFFDENDIPTDIPESEKGKLFKIEEV